MKSSMVLVMVALAAVAVSLLGALPAEACSTEVFMGQICTFPFGFCPSGFVQASGQFLAVFENQALFSLLGNTYGGDGINSFALPDLRGRAAIGATPQTFGVTGGAASTNTVSSTRSASGVSVPTTQLPSLGLTYCIALQGVYPPRN
jgi:microcystin-dependent protein